MSLAPLLGLAEFSAGTEGKVSVNDPRAADLLRGASAAVRR
ncbi:MAG: hypothetical protein ACO1ON_12855 [Nocardioides sp.]